jgi:hypothetical protein
MKPHELKNLIQYVRNSYGRQMVTPEIEDFIAGHIKHIPSEAVGWIRDQFLRRYQKCPEVLHSAILDLWHAWRAENPNRCADDPGVANGCGNENCHAGWLYFWRREEFYADHLHTFVVPCADCNRSRNTSQRAYHGDQYPQGWYPDSSEVRDQHLEEIEKEALERNSQFIETGRERIRASRGSGYADHSI